MNLNWNDIHGWDDIDRRYNMPKGTGRITRNIKDFNASALTTVGALSRVNMYIYEEKKKQKRKIVFGHNSVIEKISKASKYIRRLTEIEYKKQEDY